MDIFRLDLNGSPVPVRGTGETVGISQIKTWIRCPRAWYTEQILKVPCAEKPHLKLGTEVHAENEAYLRHHKPFSMSRAGRIAASGVHLLPAPGSPSIGGIESTYYHWLPLGGQFAGYLALYRGTLDLWEWMDQPGWIHLNDHKTAKSTQYLDSPADLAKDVQTLTYSWALNLEAAKHGAGPFRFRMRKNYYPTAQPPKFRPFPVEAEADPVVVERMGDWLAECATLMAAHAFQPEEQIPQNFDACKDFGGCDFQNRCHKPETVFDRMFQIEDARKRKPTVTEQERIAFVNAATNPNGSPFDSLGEAQIRMIYLMCLDASAPPTLTRADMLPKVREKFASASAASVDQWIGYARKNAPEVNPPEQGNAGPASAGPPSSTYTAPPPPAAGSAPPPAAAQAGQRKATDTASGPVETAIRKIFRDGFTPKSLRDFYLTDRLPARVEAFGAFRDLIGKGEKPEKNLLVNEAAREALARGMDATSAQAWATTGAPPATPPEARVPVTAAQLPAPVAAAMQAQGVTPYGEHVDPAVIGLIDSLPIRHQWAILRQIGKSDAEIKVPGMDARQWANQRLREAFRLGFDSLQAWASWAATQPAGWTAGSIDTARPFLETCPKEAFAYLADWGRVSDRARAYFHDPASIHNPRQGMAHELCCDLQERAMTTDAQFRAWVHSVTGLDVATFKAAPEPPAAPPPPPAPAYVAPPPPAPMAPPGPPPDVFQGIESTPPEVPNGPPAHDPDALAIRGGAPISERIAWHLRKIADLIEAGA